MTRRVIIAPEAREQLKTITGWWRENRPAAPTFFLDEFTRAIELLEVAPDAGPRFQRASITGVRRLFLRRSRYHLYYIHDATRSVVYLLAVWSALRGEDPTLPCSLPES